MKRLIYSLLSLAALFTVASCQPDKLIGGEKAVDDGTLVDATFAVNLGPQTKAFADGTQANQLYAGLYKVVTGGYEHVADTKVAVTGKKGQVTFEKGLRRGESYKVVFWAQHEADGFTSPYTVALNNATPTITVATSGAAANDDLRDAFYGVYETGEVTAAITIADDDGAIKLKRPFAQINILVPNTNIDNTSATTRTSAMTVAGAPNVLNLLTGVASGSVAYEFNSAAISEAAFGTFVSGYQYMAMNYVLPAQDGNGAYNVTFSVVNDGQSVTDKQVTIPLKPNVRTNIVGNIFDENFDFSSWAVIQPEAGELTEINLNVGDAGASASNPVTLSGVGATTSVTPIISRDVTGETPTITVDPPSVAKAVWNPSTKAVDITALANGTATVTVVFQAVTKTYYAEGKMTFFIEVTGVVAQQVATPTFSPAAGEYTAAQSVEIACATEGAAIYYTTDGTDPTAASTAYTAAIAVGETMTIKAIAVKEGMTDSEIATAAYTINIPAEPDFTTVAGLKALLGAESATFTGTLTDAVVSFIAGTSDAVIKDATGSILYHKESGHGLLQGQTISGDVIVDAVLYNGINEITDLAATVEGEGSAVEPEVVTLAQLATNYATYESAYVKVVGVTSKTTTTASGNINVTQDATDYVVFTKVAIPVNTGDIFTAEGTVTKYNTTEELKVWKTADLTVTTAAPVLSATPATKTVNADVKSVTWNITSNTDWTITPGTGVTASATSGNGNAEVTLTFEANTGTDAKTLTATVSADGCADVTITITQNAAGSEPEPISIVASAATICSGSSYNKYENTEWLMTCGSNNGSFGSNSNNADTKMVLGDQYVVATALNDQISSSSTHYAALISKTKVDAGITKVVLGGTMASGMTVGVTISTDGTTWTKLADFGTTTTFTFSAQQSVYYAVIIKAANKSNARFTDFTATFSNQ